MAVAARRRFVAGGALLVICLANPGVFVSWLEAIGSLARARRFCACYLSGTAFTVIAALVVLLPPGTVIVICA